MKHERHQLDLKAHIKLTADFNQEFVYIMVKQSAVCLCLQKNLTVVCLWKKGSLSIGKVANYVGRRQERFCFSYIVFITFQFCWVVVIFSITHWTGTIDNIITFLKNSGVLSTRQIFSSRTNLFFQCLFFIWIFSSFNGFNGFWQKEDILFLI